MLMILSPAKTFDFESPLPTRRRSTPAFSKQSAEVTEDHFAKALQNALQHPAVLPRTGSQAGLPAHEKTPVLQGGAAGCEVVQSGRVEDRGLAPGAFPRGHRLVSGQGGSESGSVVAADVTLEAELASVIDA